MSKNKTIYKAFPGKKFGLSGIDFLYLAEDHLLAVHPSHFHEDYKRFYFKDIQAVIIRKEWIRGCILLLFVAIFDGMYLSKGESFLIIMAGIMTLFLTGFILWSRPFCECHIQTAVQTERLPLDTFRHAHEFINRILPYIEQAQGRIGQEMPALPAGSAEKTAKS